MQRLAVVHARAPADGAHDVGERQRTVTSERTVAHRGRDGA